MSTDGTFTRGLAVDQERDPVGVPLIPLHLRPMVRDGEMRYIELDQDDPPLVDDHGVIGAANVLDTSVPPQRGVYALTRATPGDGLMGVLWMIPLEFRPYRPPDQLRRQKTGDARVLHMMRARIPPDSKETTSCFCVLPIGGVVHATPNGDAPDSGTPCITLSRNIWSPVVTGVRVAWRPAQSK